MAHANIRSAISCAPFVTQCPIFFSPFLCHWIWIQEKLIKMIWIHISLVIDCLTYFKLDTRRFLALFRKLALFRLLSLGGFRKF